MWRNQLFFSSVSHEGGHRERINKTVSRDGWLCIWYEASFLRQRSGWPQSLLNSMTAHNFYGLTETRWHKAGVLGHAEIIVFFLKYLWIGYLRWFLSETAVFSWNQVIAFSADVLIGVVQTTRTGPGRRPKEWRGQEKDKEYEKHTKNSELG